MMRGAIYGLTAAAIWGGMYVISDVVLAVIPPFTLLSIRLILALAVMSLFARRLGWYWPRGRALWSALGVGIVGYGISLGAQFVGTDKSTAINGAVLTSASPAFIVLFAVFILHEQLTRRRVAALLLATVGVLVILDPTQADFGSDTFLGDVALIIAALSWGLYSVLVRKVTADSGLDTFVLTFFCFIGGLLMTIPTAIWELSARPIGLVDGGVILGILYLGIVSTAIASWLWNRSFALVPASVASLFFFAQPLSGIILGHLFLGQPVTAALLVGGGLIAGGVLVAIEREAPRPRATIAGAGKWSG